MEAVERFLKSRGFVSSRFISGTDTPTFSGRIRIGSWRLQIELRFSEGKFNYPEAYLPEWPFDQALRAAFGYRHINANGKICYVDDSRTWWDSSMAAQLIAGSLQLIQTLLEDNLAGASSKEVIAQDFAGYWGAEQNLYIAGVAQHKAAFTQIQEQYSQRQWLISKDTDLWVKVDSKESSNTQWLVLRLNQPPTSLDHNVWPPQTINQVMSWINSNAASNIEKLIRLLQRSVISKVKAKQRNYTEIAGIILIWPGAQGSDVLGCGFTFRISEITAQAIAHNRLKQAAIMLKADKSKITRYSLNRADPKYIQTRSTPDNAPSLKNKRVILVGAGTIGGHLAKLLCAHGAGWGKGKFHIIDPDIFSIENIGRHSLGAGSIGQSKARAVVTHLQRDFPYLNIEAYPRSISRCWNLFTDNCIIIDATGSQTVGIAIPDYLSQKGLNPLVLHSWVHGHGAATVALLNDRKIKNSACYRCLWRLEDNSYQPRYPLSREPSQDAPIFAGCHQSFHAYASTVSMIAATQAMTLLHQHIIGEVRNTLTFQVIRKDLCQNRPDATPHMSKSCPICQR